MPCGLLNGSICMATSAVMHGLKWELGTYLHAHTYCALISVDRWCYYCAIAKGAA